MTQSRWFRILALAALAMPAFADQASKQALVDELLTLTKADAMITTMLQSQRGMIQRQMKQMIVSDPRLEAAAKDVEPVIDEFENKVFAALQKSLNWQDLKPRMEALYADMFSEQELAAIVTFYKTDAGKSFLTKMPELATRAMQLGQQQVQSAMPEIQRLSLEMREKAAKVAAGHAKEPTDK